MCDVLIVERMHYRPTDQPINRPTDGQRLMCVVAHNYHHGSKTHQKEKKKNYSMTKKKKKNYSEKKKKRKKQREKEKEKEKEQARPGNDASGLSQRVLIM